MCDSARVACVCVCAHACPCLCFLVRDFRGGSSPWGFWNMSTKMCSNLRKMTMETSKLRSSCFSRSLKFWERFDMSAHFLILEKNWIRLWRRSAVSEERFKNTKHQRDQKTQQQLNSHSLHTHLVYIRSSSQNKIFCSYQQNDRVISSWPEFRRSQDPC